MENMELLKLLRNEMYDKCIEQEPLAYAIIQHLMKTDKDTANKILDEVLVILENKLAQAITNQTEEQCD
ncbi:MAG: hypothetical protein J6L69_10425 [Lachnospiraceae bacterium]|nr:hypothetical protein [Lachnospiraceae bacterium]